MRAGKAPLGAPDLGLVLGQRHLGRDAGLFHKVTPDDVTRDPEVRDLLERGDSSVDPDARKEAYAKALALIAERAYAVPLYSLPTYLRRPARISCSPPIRTRCRASGK